MNNRLRKYIWYKTRWKGTENKESIPRIGDNRTDLQWDERKTMSSELGQHLAALFAEYLKIVTMEIIR